MKNKLSSARSVSYTHLDVYKRQADNSSNLDVTATTTANVETTADLVETKVVEAPATTENVASTENTTNEMCIRDRDSTQEKVKI